MDIGFGSLKGADEFLQTYPQSDAWFDAEEILPKSGTITTSMPSPDKSKFLIGVGTLFSSEFIVGNWIDSDYQISRLVSITDDLNVEVSKPLGIYTGSEIFLLSSEQASRRLSLYKKKIAAMTQAYREIMLYCENLPDVITSDILEAQYLHAFQIFKLPVDRHAENQDAGIEEQSIGDVRVKYKQGLGDRGSGMRFSKEVKDMLKAYLKVGRIHRLFRSGMNRGDLTSQGSVEGILEV